MNTSLEKINARISPEVPDFSKDPYFIKKGQASKAFLEKMASQKNCCR
jgi:hypothetical protein